MLILFRHSHVDTIMELKCITNSGVDGAAYNTYLVGCTGICQLPSLWQTLASLPIKSKPLLQMQMKMVSCNQVDILTLQILSLETVDFVRYTVVYIKFIFAG